MNNRIVFASLIGISIISSCCHDAKKNTANSVDTVTVQIPEELKKINTELIADPTNPDLFHKRAKYYYGIKRIDAGLSDMMRVLNIDSTKSDYFLTLSNLYFISNKTAAAKRSLEKCIKLDNKNVDALLKLAELYLFVREHDKSIDYIDMALKVDKYNSKAYFMKGMCYKELKDTLHAISSMQTSVEQDQKNYQAFMQLGLLCAAQKNPLAIQYYKNAIKIEPKSVEAFYDLGKFYQDIKDWTNCFETYNALLAFDQYNKSVHYNIAAVNLLELKKYETAIEHFDAAIEIDPEFFEAYYARGLAYQALRKKDLALNDFTSCLKINSNFAPAQAAFAKIK